MLQEEPVCNTAVSFLYLHHLRLLSTKSLVLVVVFVLLVSLVRTVWSEQTAGSEDLNIRVGQTSTVQCFSTCTVQGLVCTCTVEEISPVIVIIIEICFRLISLTTLNHLQPLVVMETELL